MKIPVLLFCILPVVLEAQNRVGINTVSPDCDLDIRSMSDAQASELNLGNADNTHFLRLRSGDPGSATPIIYWNHGDTLEISRADVDGSNYQPFLSLDGRTIGVHNTGRSIFIGDGAGEIDDLSNNAGIGIGSGALRSNSIGGGNVAIGDSALAYSTASFNTAIGYQALKKNTTGQDNTAVGVSALGKNTTGDENTAVGKIALFSNTYGWQNTPVGHAAMSWNTTGAYNTAVGFGALFYNQSGLFTTVVGYGVMTENTTGHENTVIGTHALKSNTTGRYNTGAGAYTLQNNITGGQNVAVGLQALYHNTVVSKLVAVGDSALLNNGVGASGPDQAHRNTAVGSKALYMNGPGYDNTAMGYEALSQTSVGFGNVAVGKHALRSNSGGYGNTGIGTDALSEIPSGSENTAVGYRAMVSFDFGEFNTALGAGAMENKTAGGSNTAIGSNAMKTNLTGSENTVVGVAAGYDEGNQNTIIGTQAGGGMLQQGSERSGCVFIGYKAGFSVESNNKLFIDNSSTMSPLIYGEFDNNLVKINGSQTVTNGLLSTGGSYGVKGSSSSNTGRGVYGETSGDSGKALHGHATGIYGKGIHAVATGTHSSVNAILAQATGGGSAWAGWFTGDVHIDGNLSKSSGSFKIDHPLDPENKYLYHSFVESPDMMNVYNGNITTDAHGYAIVELPEYFDALNQDFRYQLTVIGDFAQAVISEEVVQNQFTIRTDKPGVKVSWQVTGIRKDPWAQENRIEPEVEKEPENKGKYLTPTVYGKSRMEGIGHWEERFEAGDK